MLQETDLLRNQTPTDFIVEDNLLVPFVINTLDVVVD